jgi:hypothetical protein
VKALIWTVVWQKVVYAITGTPGRGSSGSCVQIFEPSGPKAIDWMSNVRRWRHRGIEPFRNFPEYVEHYESWLLRRFQTRVENTNNREPGALLTVSSWFVAALNGPRQDVVTVLSALATIPCCILHLLPTASSE